MGYVKRGDPLRVGVHPHQVPEKEPAQFSEIPVVSATVLDIDAGYYLQRMETNNRRFNVEGVYTDRLYHPDMMSRQPEEVAGAMIVEAEKWNSILGGRLYIQYRNELKLGVEHGNNPHIQAYLDTQQGGREIMLWDLRVVKSAKSRAPWMQIAGPYEAPGHQDIDGHEEIRMFADAGYFEYVDAFGGHYYAEGPDRQGFDAPDREWYSDRVFKVRNLLDELGYKDLPIFIGECNRKQINVGDTMGEFIRYCERLQGLVERVDWFVYSSGDPSFSDMQLSRLPNIGPRYRDIVYKFFQGWTAPPTPESPPEQQPTPPAPGSVIAYVEARYNIKHTDGKEAYLADLIVRGDPNNIEAFGPPDMMVKVATYDNNYHHEGLGHAELSGFGQPSKYYPTQGQTGYYYATCGDARVDGLGWAFGLPDDTGAHTNVVPTFAKGALPEPPPEPTPDPEPEPGPELTPEEIQLRKARVYIDWAAARWDKKEPHQDMEAFGTHISNLIFQGQKKATRDDLYEYGYPVPGYTRVNYG